jgi:thiamine pyrophosphate-dependent acetolactate synthase large subunit-like protein
VADIKVAAAVAKVLKEEGAEWYAGVHGGHVWQFMTEISRVGMLEDW